MGRVDLLSSSFPLYDLICTKMARFCLIECTEKQQHFKHTVLFCISLKITPIVFSLDEFLRFVSNGIPFKSNSKKFEGNQILNLLVLIILNQDDYLFFCKIVEPAPVSLQV